MWKTVARNTGAVLIRIAIGIPIFGVFMALFYSLVLLVGAIAAHPVIALNVFCALLGLAVSYAVGNVAIKRYRERQEYKKFQRDFYD